MTADQRIKLQIGELIVQLILAQAENDALKAKVAEIEKPAPEAK